tara:strand:+ start:1469 stop:1579 length:111 start_codon:yes stop_codon:yes gene_type:complete
MRDENDNTPAQPAQYRRDPNAEIKPKKILMNEKMFS